mmetsp:Transcript_42340/g.83152  ORF Transcript_42340/g.83152 Transcript_42340/m.83152 type:complete len:294 (-) Transcript_42340:30-911(-)
MTTHYQNLKTLGKRSFRKSHVRIINGFETPTKRGKERYRYFALSVGGLGSCGGTLIADNVVISAAHCLPAFKSEVLIGIYSKYFEDRFSYERFNILKRIPHKKYIPGTDDSDYMLIILDGKSKFTPACIPSYANFVEKGKELRVLGFGVTEDGKESSLLREVNVESISNSQCGRRYSRWKKPGPDDDNFDDGWMPSPISKNMLCADSSKLEKDACQGDSGGPLIVADDDGGRDVLVGVVSWGIGCAEYPGVYSRMNIRAGRWIRRIVEKHGGILPNCSKRQDYRPFVRTSFED